MRQPNDLVRVHAIFRGNGNAQDFGSFAAHGLLFLSALPVPVRQVIVAMRGGGRRERTADINKNNKAVARSPADADLWYNMRKFR